MEHQPQFGGATEHEVERLAREQAEAYERIRLPASAEELITATIDPGMGAVDRLLPILSRAAVGSLSSFQDILLQISARLRAILLTYAKKGEKEREEPTDFAKHLVRSVQGFDDPKVLAGLSDIAEYVIAELHPLILKAWQEYAVLVESISDDAKERLGLPKTKAQFFDALTIGMVEEQNVHSLFGLFALLAEKNPHFPHLNSETQELPKKLVITDPLGQHQTDYWTERVAAHKAMYGKEIRLSGLVKQRTTSAIYELQEVELRTRDQELKNAIQSVSEWLDSEQGQLEGLDDEAFVGYTAGLHFAYGDPEILITLLNSLEIIKQKVPYLYVRLLGRSPNPVTPENTRSDMFGNVLHIAFHHSMNLQTGKGTEEYQALQSFLSGLTRMEARQDVIAPLSDEEFAYMEKVLSEYIQEGVQENNFMPTVFSAIMFGEKKRAYLMGKMLERVSAENRERLLQELRTATPREFIRLVRGRRLFPHRTEYYYDITRWPQDAMAILKSRVGAIHLGGVWPENKETIVWINEVNFGALDKLLEFLRYEMKRPRADYKQPLAALKRELWKSTPSEKMLKGDEFYQWLEERIRTRNKTAVYDIIDVVNTHTNISEKQWRSWRMNLISKGPIIYNEKRDRTAELLSFLCKIVHSFESDEFKKFLIRFSTHT
ncbi:hypothetical protein HY620_01565 [Candidatus Uhrbacteria bacterium]|nr:hypothetical protein [Candidatus Uhrbacteria bacterium]